jgi:hypothetical protein
MGAIHPSGDINITLSKEGCGGPSDELGGWKLEIGYIKLQLEQHHAILILHFDCPNDSVAVSYARVGGTARSDAIL